MPKVFISFIEEDVRVARAVKDIIEHEYRQLIRREDIFLSADRWTLRHGENWMDRIKRELTECDVLVSLLSKRSIEYPWINFEAGAAWVSDKLLAVYFGNLTIPTIRRPFSDLILVNLQNAPYGLIQGISQVLSANARVPFLTPPPLHNDDERVQALQQELAGFVDTP